MHSIGTFEAKTHLARLLDRVAAGEQITITRHGTPIARLVPVKHTGSLQLRETIAKLKDFSEGQTLGGLKIKELVNKGRRWVVTHFEFGCLARLARGVGGDGVGGGVTSISGGLLNLARTASTPQLKRPCAW